MAATATSNNRISGERPAPRARDMTSTTITPVAPTAQASGRDSRGQRLHLGQRALERGPARLEVRLEEDLGDAGVGVTPEILANLRDGAPQRAAIGALRLGGEVERAPADD